MIKHRSLAKLIILSLLTCGIYGIFFWWGYINDINEVCVCDGKKSPNIIVVALLSVLTCGLYYLIWLYRQGERLQAIAPDYGLTLKDGGGSVLVQYLLGSFFMSLGSSLGSAASMANGKYSVAVAGFSDAAMRDMVSALHIAPDAVLMLLFSGTVLYLLGLVLTLSSFNVLIKNLNAVGRVYNERCR
jgi:hypothetical protein